MSLDTYDYPSRRSAVLSTGGMVATSQPLAAQAGLAILQAGGNAIDAVLATAITLTVVEPTSNGIGSDAFAIVWDGEKLHGLNASGPAPRALSRAGVARRRTHRVPRARVDECSRSRRARRLGGAARAVRAGGVRLALCRRDPARRGGVPGLAGDLAALAPGRSRLHRHRRPRPRRVGAGVHLRGANPRRGGGVAQRRARGDVAAAGIGGTPGFLRGRAGHTHCGVRPEHRRHARR